MGSYTCPFCQHTMFTDNSTHREFNFEFDFVVRSTQSEHQTHPYEMKLHTYKCPNCLKISSHVKYIGANLPEMTIPIFPASNAKQFPEYIPKSIINDYEEASSIVHLSPKASATLSRRCLQGMIRDFWGISKNRLVDEIDALKEIIPSSLWRVIDSLRKIGNIGAHMQKDKFNCRCRCR